MQQVVICLLYALPSIFGLLLASAGASLKLAVDAAKSAFKDLPKTAEKMSDEWVRRALQDGFPYLWERQLKKCFYAIAVLTTIGTWLLSVLTPAFLLSLLF
jgi:hypothetical protein